jgi:hypothetical protein
MSILGAFPNCFFLVFWIDLDSQGHRISILWVIRNQNVFSFLKSVEIYRIWKQFSEVRFCETGKTLIELNKFDYFGLKFSGCSCLYRSNQPAKFQGKRWILVEWVACFNWKSTRKKLSKVILLIKPKKNEYFPFNL